MRPVLCIVLSLGDVGENGPRVFCRQIQTFMYLCGFICKSSGVQCCPKVFETVIWKQGDNVLEVMHNEDPAAFEGASYTQ